MRVGPGALRCRLRADRHGHSSVGSGTHGHEALPASEPPLGRACGGPYDPQSQVTQQVLAELGTRPSPCVSSDWGPHPGAVLAAWACPDQPLPCPGLPRGPRASGPCPGSPLHDSLFQGPRGISDLFVCRAPTCGT